LSDRPQVLAALIKASVGAVNAADAPSMRRRSLAEALASDEDRAVVGAPFRAVGETTQLSPAQLDPTGFEAIEDTVAVHDAKAPLPPPQSPPMPPPTAGRRDPNAETFAQQQARLQLERRAQAARSAQAWAAQRPKDGRRTTIPPPTPRTRTPSPANHGRTTGNAGRTTARVGPSIAPTAVNVSSIPVRPASLLRDRLMLAGAVAAASLAAVVIYGSLGAPSPATSAAGSASMAALPAAPPPPAASPAIASAVAAALASTEHRPVESPGVVKPVAEAAAPAAVSPAPHPPAAARVAKGPRPKIAAGNTKQPASANPYDSPASEPLEQLVEERR
jgi:hypothetical protein